MSGEATVKGWCPGALRPMRSGDGLLVRVRPFGGRLRRAQADGLATLAAVHGNGLLDLSSRGNVQLRGVREESHAPLIEGLRGLRLVDASVEAEARRNVMVTPFWQTGDETELLVAELTEALAATDAPDLPGKFGFAVDTGRAPVLATASADIRLERDAGGGLVLVADGMAVGKPVTTGTAVAEALALARWFVAERDGESRMAALLERATPEGHFVPRRGQSFDPRPGHSPHGALVGLALGQLRAETFATLAKHGGMRMTPWRMLLVESARQLPQIEGIITDPEDPLLRVVACTGAPRCAQAHGDTRDLARSLAPHLGAGRVLHVSGCTKGCARKDPADRTVVVRPDGYDLIENGTAADSPTRAGLTQETLIKAI